MEPRHPPLRTFGRTRSRAIKPRQAALMSSLLPALAIPEGPFDPRAVIPEATDVWLEIGFGGGEHMAAQAARRPDVLILGAEPFLNGVASALRHIEAGKLANVRLAAGDARDLMAALPDASLGRLSISSSTLVHVHIATSLMLVIATRILKINPPTITPITRMTTGSKTAVKRLMAARVSSS